MQYFFTSLQDPRCCRFVTFKVCLPVPMLALFSNSSNIRHKFPLTPHKHIYTQAPLHNEIHNTPPHLSCFAEAAPKPYTFSMSNITMMRSPTVFESVRSDFSPSLTQRACQLCCTTVTSQWRYGFSGKCCNSAHNDSRQICSSSQSSNLFSYSKLCHSGKMLLCNACGIRWKRKNQATERRRQKPGPKRIRHLTKSQPYTLQPSLAPIFRTSSVKPPINKSIFSSSVTNIKAEPCLRAEFGSFSEKKYHRTLPPCWKMDLGQLLQPTEEPVRKSFCDERNTKVGPKPYSSPISISSLLNFADE